MSRLIYTIAKYFRGTAFPLVYLKTNTGKWFIRDPRVPDVHMHVHTYIHTCSRNSDDQSAEPVKFPQTILSPTAQNF